MKPQLAQLLKDVLPTHSGDIPPKLEAYVESLYHLSTQKIPVLPNKAEVARYHLCAYIGAEKYKDRFGLSSPLLRKIPVQPKVVPKLLNDIREKVLPAAVSPALSPVKKRQAQPIEGSPLKKLAFEDEKPKKEPKKYKRLHKRLTAAEFMSLANNFHIPAHVTCEMMKTFWRERHKFQRVSEWCLACGLVYTAYVRINDRLIKSSVGKKQEVQEQLFQYQSGGMIKSIMLGWINAVEESMKAEPWVIDLEVNYVHNNWSTEDKLEEEETRARLGPSHMLLLVIGSMRGASVAYDSALQQQYYDTWTKRLVELVKLRTNPH